MDYEMYSGLAAEQENDMSILLEFYPHSQIHRFPTSSVREEHACIIPPPSRTPTDAPNSPSTPSSSHLPPRRKLQQGVWLYGSNIVYTADHPALRAYIMEAQATLHLPANLPEPLMALAALELFYHPESPVHWLFWSDEKKRGTAELVNRICLRKPQIIDCQKTSWNGITEYLSVLSQVHGSGYRHRFEGQDWYQILVPPKIKSPARVLNLRKRKPAQLVALCETQEQDIDDDGTEVQEPSRKRPKTKRAGSERKVVQSDDAPAEEGGMLSSELRLRSAAPSVAPSSGSGTPHSELSALPELPAENSAPTTAPLRVSTRPRKPKRTPDATPPPLMSSTSSSGSPTTTEIATPPSVPNTGIRIRSASRSSAETLVGCPRNTSLDRSSVETVVQLMNQQIVKGKGREMKQESLDLAMAIEVDPSEDQAQLVEDKANRGMRTRSRGLRASSASTEASNKGPIDDLLVEENPTKISAKSRSASTRRWQAKTNTKS